MMTTSLIRTTRILAALHGLAVVCTADDADLALRDVAARIEGGVRDLLAAVADQVRYEHLTAADASYPVYGCSTCDALRDAEQILFETGL